MPVAVSSVAETNVVVSAVVPNITCAPLIKPLPFTWIVNVPTPIVCGLTDVTTGIGFSRVTALVPCTVGVLTSEACTGHHVARGAGRNAGGRRVLAGGADRATVALPPAIPFTDQVTAVFDVPVTVAVNCSGGIARANVGRRGTERNCRLERLSRSGRTAISRSSATSG